MVGLYILLSIAVLLGIANAAIMAGIGLFLLRLAASMKENRDNVATAIEDITDMVRLMRANMEDFKNFIRSLV